SSTTNQTRSSVHGLHSRLQTSSSARQLLPMSSLSRFPGRGPPMIQLTRLNNARLALNSDLIKYVEEAPDTVITLLSGEKLVVRETTGQVIERVLEFRRAILR